MPFERELSTQPSRATEREWLEGIQQGDHDAFTHAFRAFFNRLCVYAETFVGSPDVSEDLVEEIFVYLWREHERLDIRAPLNRYLYVAVRNRSLKHIRDHRKYRHARVDDGSVRDPWQGMWSAQYSPAMSRSSKAATDEELNVNELAAVVRTTLASLSVRRREAFLLARQHDLTHVEIGEVMGISVSTVEKHIVAAARALKKAVDDYYSTAV